MTYSMSCLLACVWPFFVVYDESCQSPPPKKLSHEMSTVASLLRQAQTNWSFPHVISLYLMITHDGSKSILIKRFIDLCKYFISKRPFEGC